MVAIVAGLALGCVGLLMLGMQPLLLGTLLDEHRLSVAQLTQAATGEMLSLGAVSGLMGGVVPHRSMRRWGLLGCSVMAGANAASMFAGGLVFVLWRVVAGAGGGVLVWVAIGAITRHAAATRLSAIFLAAQAATQGILAALLPVTFMPAFGANAGLAALGLIAAASAALLPLLPADLPNLPEAGAGAGTFGVRAGCGLLSSFLFMAGIVGLWVFVDPLAAVDRITPSVAKFAVASSLFAQMTGALVVSVFEHVLPPARMLIASCLGCLLAVGVIASGPGDPAFLGAILLHGFLWIFALPFFVPLLIRIDPTRRSAMLLVGAELLGGSAGPQITGWFATDANVRPVLGAAAVLFVGALATVLMTLLGRQDQQAGMIAAPD